MWIEYDRRHEIIHLGLQGLLCILTHREKKNSLFQNDAQTLTLTAQKASNEYFQNTHLFFFKGTDKGSKAQGKYIYLGQQSLANNSLTFYQQVLRR